MSVTLADLSEELLAGALARVDATGFEYRLELLDREEVLDQAMLLFWQQGYEATAMTEASRALTSSMLDTTLPCMSSRTAIATTGTP